MIGIPLSIVFGGPLSGWLLGFEGHLGLHGWQWMYLAEGLPAVLLGFVVLGYLTEKPQRSEVAHRRSSVTGLAARSKTSTRRRRRVIASALRTC